MAISGGAGTEMKSAPKAPPKATGWAAFALAAAAALAVVLGVTQPAGAESVPLRVGTHPGYGRIVFAWTQPVEYQAEVKDGRLVVSFDRAIEADTGALVRVLGGYVKDATAGSDGRSLSFGLAGEFGLKTFRNGSAVVVDLLVRGAPSPPAAKAAKQGTAKAAKSDPASATAKERVRVRVGIHADKTRLVFDWSSPTAYSLDRQGETLTVFFDRPAHIEVDRLASRPPPLVLAASAESSETSSIVSLAIVPGAVLNHFTAGTRVVVDIVSPAAEMAAQSPSVPPPAAPAVAPAATPEGASRPRSLSPPAAGLPAAAPAAKTETAPAAVQAAKVEPAKGPSTKPEAAPAAKPGATPSPVPADSGRPVSLVPGLPEVIIREHEVQTGTGSSTTTGAAAGQGAVRSEAKGPSVGISLRFDWAEPTGMAIFRRSAALWVVFARASQPDLNTLRQAGGNVIRGITQVPHPEATILRLDVVAGINPVPRREGLSWVLDFHRQPIDAINRLDIGVQPETRRGRVLISVADAATVITAVDPEAGDNLLIVPTVPAAYGMAYPYSFAAFDLLTSAQGIAVKPWIDTLHVRAVPQGVEITSPDGLALSEVPAEAEAQVIFGMNRPLTRVFDLDKWRLQDLASFVPRRQQLMLAVAAAKPGEEKEKTRMDLARFYFANGFSAEALVVLAEVVAQRADAANTGEFRLLRGGSNYLMGRIPEAREDFAFKGLDTIDEGAFWRAIVEAVAGDRAQAARDLRRVGPMVRFYPRNLALPLGLIVAETAIDLGDLKVAIFYLESLLAAQPTPQQRAYIDYLEGRIFEFTGDFEKAAEKWDAVAAGRDRLARFMAARSRIELQLKLKELSPGGAIEDLEGLRYAWRGDEMEFQLLRRLGSLYIEEKDFREGLLTLRQAATYFREHARAPEVTQQMADVFARLFLDDEADKLPPVTAIALFEEFRELTPVGVRGDEMIRKLADRLAAVDLLDRAEELLRGQVEFRLKGAERARVGAQLALIYLLDGKPDQTLETLKATDEPGLPGDLVAQRRHLGARALMAKGEGEAALLALKEDGSLDAERLKTEVYWAAQDWDRAIQALQRVLRVAKAEPRRPLNRDQASHVFNLAVAMVMAGNERGIARLKTDYGQAMAETDYAKGFDLISGQTALDGIKRGEISQEVRAVLGFQNFLAAYKERLKAQGLSSIN